MNRRKLLEIIAGTSLIGLAGGIGVYLNLPQPLDSLNENERKRIHSIFEKNKKSFYFMPEVHGEGKITDYLELIASITSKEKIDCLLVEGLEGDVDNLAKKITNDLLTHQEIGKRIKQGELQELTYETPKKDGEILFSTKNYKILIPQIDLENWLGNSPGSITSWGLRNFKYNIPIYGIEDMRLYNESIDITIAGKIDYQLEALRGEVEHPLPRDLKVYVYPKNILDNASKLIPQLESKLDTLKKRCRYMTK